MGQFLGELEISPAQHLNDVNIEISVLFDRAVAFSQRFQAEINSQLEIFVDGDTSEYKELVQTAGADDLEDMGQDPKTLPKDIGVTGEYEVAFPITTAGAGLSYTEIQLGHFTAGRFERDLMNILNANANSTGKAVRKAIFNQDNITDHQDKFKGLLNLRKLANLDGSLYNPKIGESAVSDRQHYISLVSATIDDANNPYEKAATLLQESFGTRQGGERIMTFIHKDEVAETEDLADFVELGDDFITDNVNISQLTGLPVGFPGTLIGRVKNKSWVVQWDYQVAKYMFSVHLDQPKPLMRRVYAPSTGIDSGFNMRQIANSWPLVKLAWTKNEGYAVRNRLNGVAQFIDAGANYVTPAQYA